MCDELQPTVVIRPFLTESGAEMLIDQDAHHPLAVIATIDSAKRSQKEALKAIVNLASYGAWDGGGMMVLGRIPT